MKKEREYVCFICFGINYFLEQKPSKSIQKAFRKTMTSTKKLLDQINPATKQHKETKEIERDEEDFQDLSALPLPKSIYLQVIFLFLLFFCFEQNRNFNAFQFFMNRNIVC